MEKVVEMICDYCGTEITEKNHTCPHCGADCSQKIKKYKEQKRKEEELHNEEVRKHSKEVIKGFKRTSVIAILIFVLFFVAIIGLVIYGAVAVEKNKGIRENNIINTDGEKIEIGFNEDAETNKYIVTLDSYELYEYKSDEFPNQFNTPEGYQKIAFHFIYTNNSKSRIYTSKISLTADDYTVDKSELEIGIFEEVVKGKEKYSPIENKYVSPEEKLQGYVGFLVPKDKKVLRFHLTDNVFIVMDNPVYRE